MIQVSTSINEKTKRLGGRLIVVGGRLIVGAIRLMIGSRRLIAPGGRLITLGGRLIVPGTRSFQHILNTKLKILSLLNSCISIYIMNKLKHCNAVITKA